MAKRKDPTCVNCIILRDGTMLTPENSSTEERHSLIAEVMAEAPGKQGYIKVTKDNQTA
jgi:hypothetical protein